MELQILLDEVEGNKDVIFSRHSTVVMNNSKKRVWEGICEKVYAVSTGYTRRVELGKKWSTYASDTKKISSNRREALKTGGRSASPKKIDVAGSDFFPNCPSYNSLQEHPSTSSRSMTRNLTKKESVGKRPADDVENCSQNLVQAEKEGLRVEEERLAIEKQRLEIGKQRLEIEKQRLEIDTQTLIIAQQRHQLHLAQLGIQFLPPGGDNHLFNILRIKYLIIES